MQRQPGFTLIELMVTMAILAIIAAVALPNYTDYLKRGRIPEATSNLQAMKTKMEQWFQDNRTYPSTCGTAAGATQIAVPTLQYFTITCPVLNANSYTIQAVGGVGGGDQSMAGITYQIDQANSRSTIVTAGSTMANFGYPVGTTPCWLTKKTGSC
jgi:prepilin-type N-terminal cleavage/methylation domain-containing protein